MAGKRGTVDGSTPAQTITRIWADALRSGHLTGARRAQLFGARKASLSCEAGLTIFLHLPPSRRNPVHPPERQLAPVDCSRRSPVDWTVIRAAGIGPRSL